jgi:phospholipase C
MANQIPAACTPLQIRVNNLTNQLQLLREQLAEGDPADRARIRNLIGAKEQALFDAKLNLQACIDNPPIPPPPDHFPGIPDECVAIYKTVNTLTAQLAALKDEFKNSGTAEDPNIKNKINAKANELQIAKDNLQACIVLNTYPFFNPAPLANKPNISNDTTPVPMKKIIPWSLLQKKVDEFFNLRTDPPLFKIRLHNHFSGTPQLASDATISMIEAKLIDGQIQTVYGEIGYFNLGLLPSGFHFDDINSSTFNVFIDPTAAEPLMVKINFETGGAIEAPTKEDLLSDIDFFEFYITIKLSFDHSEGKLEYFSWVDNLKKITDDGDLNEAIDKYIVAYIDSTEDWDFGGAFQKKIRRKIYDKLADQDIREQLSRIVSRWLLGGKGDFTITSLDKRDPGQVTIYYTVPKYLTDPFPEAEHRGTGWPYLGNPAPDPAINFSLPGNMKNIKNIVVLMMENRSFDHMLGYLSLPVSAGGAGRADVEGLKPDRGNPVNGVNYPSFPLAPGDTKFGPDPAHGYEPVYHQINTEVDATKKPITGKGRMDGFVKSYSLEANGNGPSIMGYHTAENVPVYDALVRDFGISDYYFASHPGSTFCNRFYELTGRLNLASGLLFNKLPEGTWEVNNSKPLTPVFTKNIFDYLTEYQNAIDKKVTWKYYEHGYSFMRFFSKYTFNNTNIADVNDPYTGFFADAKRGTLPSVSYIDPHYIEMPPNANCDGPVADIKVGQEFVRKVVEAVITSPQYANTLLVITYDEHGGFPDHVAPPPALPYLDESSPQSGPEFPVKTYGIRVPTFFISPYIKAGSVFGHAEDAKGETLYFDHTSILKTIARRFMSKNPPYMGKRYAAAKDFSAVLNSTKKKAQFLPFVGHNILYSPGAMRMAVEGGTPTSPIVGRFVPNDTDEQKFAIEQYGSFVFIRTFYGNRYLTVDVPDGNTTMPGQGFSIKQDIKYEGAPALTDPVKFNIKYQLWKCTPLDKGTGKNLFTISNAFFKKLVLRPVELGNNAAPIVLGTKIATYPNLWAISIP